MEDGGEGEDGGGGGGEVGRMEGEKGEGGWRMEWMGGPLQEAEAELRWG